MFYLLVRTIRRLVPLNFSYDASDYIKTIINNSRQTLPSRLAYSPAGTRVCQYTRAGYLAPLGKKLTLVNPAYVTRQVHEIAKTQYGVQGHITSLNPTGPANAPDDWEAQALQELESGRKYVSIVIDIQGNEHVRVMRPIAVEKGDLK